MEEEEEKCIGDEAELVQLKRHLPSELETIPFYVSGIILLEICEQVQ